MPQLGVAERRADVDLEVVADRATQAVDLADAVVADEDAVFVNVPELAESW